MDRKKETLEIELEYNSTRRKFEFYAVHEADEKCLTVKILNDTIFSINPMRE